MNFLHNLILSSMLMSANVLAEGYLHAFPDAEEGMTKHVIELPKQVNESSLKVELQVGKYLSVDTVNQYSFSGKIESEVIEGWGFTRYFVNELGPVLGTMMAPESGLQKKEQFIYIDNSLSLIRYNSEVPLVIYVPEDGQVRYRIWRAETLFHTGT